MQKKLNKFFSIFEELPQISILHLYSNDFLDLNKELNSFVKKLNGSLVTFELDYKNYLNFKSRSRDFEYIIISELFNKLPNKKVFFTKIYHLLENSAQIIILDRNKNLKDEIIELLNSCNFLVPNNIELFDNSLLIVAKKMHMWDPGL